MDFSLTEEQEAIRDLARQILADRVTHERLLELERSGEWFDTDLWGELARANLTALVVPEAQGGGGFGMEELCCVLEEQGRHTAPVPLLATAVLGAMPIAAFGTPEQHERWLRPVAEDEAVLSAALVELGSSNPSAPRTSAKRDGDGWRLDGEKQCVPAAHLARAILVPARTPDGVGVFLVDPKAPGVSLERQIATHREPQSRLSLSGVQAVDVLGEPDRGEEIVTWIADRASLALSAIQVGVAAGATARTATYISERKQFGKPIGTFQGVVMRAADAYIDVEALRGMVIQAAWHVAAGRPSHAEIAATKWWAATAGQRVVHTAQHLHGGIGSDIEYPIHRYFLWAKQNELLFGGANEQLARLGAYLVSDAHAQAES
jgi:alkylation response protein AidB-like acyl-CoA dehydrogenase